MSNAIAWHSANAASFDARYASSAAFRERLAIWDGLMARHITGESQVLDAGCGSGILSELAARRARSVDGFDGSAEMIALAQARAAKSNLANARFEVAALETAPLLQTRSYDVILCSSVLEYVGDWSAAFDRLARALKPAGVLVFSMPNGASLYRQAERLLFSCTGRPAYYAHVRHLLRAGAVDHVLAQRGFVALSRQYYARAPLLSPLARALNCREWADTLFVTVCQRVPAPAGTGH